MNRARKENGDPRFFKGDFVVTKDLICEGGGDRNDKGTSNRSDPWAIEKILEKGKEFRMLDDDGNIYYYGKCLTDFGEEAFNPLDSFGRGNAGCTDVQYRGKTGEWESI